MRTMVFDLDGTLADTSADLIAAANLCFRELGHGDLLSPEADALIAFHGGRAMLRAGFARTGEPWSEEMVDAQYPLFLMAYAEELDRETRLYPGAGAAVERLRAAGWKTGICTNKPEVLAEELLKRLGVRDAFDALIGADTLPVRKPDPLPLSETVRRAGGTPARAILIGDTETDRETARRAGVPSVLVTFGPEGQGVARLAPEALLDHYDALDEIAGRLLPG
jgi:phosphoglycolate phosphatase